LLAEGNCGGDIGKNTPNGGCDQLYPEPNCEEDSDCDDGDVCTADTCENGQCQNKPDCGFCGKSKVDVQITIDNYGGETTYDIKDSSGTKVMEGSGWPANSVNSFWQCFDSGAYSFTITDGYGDGICCTYGNGGYSVKVDDGEVASGGDFGSSETKPFNVGTSAPVSPTTPSPSTSAPVPSPTTSTPSTSAPVTPPPKPVTSSSVFPSSTAAPVPTPDATPYPTGTAPTMYPTQTAPTMYPTAAVGPVPTPYPTGTPPTLYPTDVPPTTCGEKGDFCTKHNQCCGGKCNLKKKLCRKNKK